VLKIWTHGGSRALRTRMYFLNLTTCLYRAIFLKKKLSRQEKLTETIKRGASIPQRTWFCLLKKFKFFKNVLFCIYFLKNSFIFYIYTLFYKQIFILNLYFLYIHHCMIYIFFSLFFSLNFIRIYISIMF
jgi:hypothetical protein